MHLYNEIIIIANTITLSKIYVICHLLCEQTFKFRSKKKKTCPGLMKVFQAFDKSAVSLIVIESYYAS